MRGRSVRRARRTVDGRGGDIGAAKLVPVPAIVAACACSVGYVTVSSLSELFELSRFEWYVTTPLPGLSTGGFEVPMAICFSRSSHCKRISMPKCNMWNESRGRKAVI